MEYDRTDRICYTVRETQDSYGNNTGFAYTYTDGDTHKLLFTKYLNEFGHFTNP